MATTCDDGPPCSSAPENRRRSLGMLARALCWLALAKRRVGVRSDDWEGFEPSSDVTARNGFRDPNRSAQPSRLHALRGALRGSPGGLPVAPGTTERLTSNPRVGGSKPPRRVTNP